MCGIQRDQPQLRGCVAINAEFGRHKEIPVHVYVFTVIASLWEPLRMCTLSPFPLMKVIVHMYGKILSEPRCTVCTAVSY